MQRLLNWHRDICRVTGALAYVIYLRRVRPETLRHWAGELRRVADQMERESHGG